MTNRISLDLVEQLRTSPPDQYIGNQFNKCPQKIQEYLQAAGSDIQTVVDFGCGHGIKALSIALSNPERQVVGVDITRAFERASKFARESLGLETLPENLSFKQIRAGQSLREVVVPDFIYSWSVFEHIERDLLQPIINDMYESLTPKGAIFYQIAPLFFSPYGSHLRDYVDEPWAHLIYSHAMLREKVERADDEALTPEEKKKRKWMFGQFEALNKLTSDDLERMLRGRGFSFIDKQVMEVSIRPPKEIENVYQRRVLVTNELLYFAGKERPSFLRSVLR